MARAAVGGFVQLITLIDETTRALREIASARSITFTFLPKPVRSTLEEDLGFAEAILEATKEVYSRLEKVKDEDGDREVVIYEGLLEQLSGFGDIPVQYMTTPWWNVANKIALRIAARGLLKDRQGSRVITPKSGEPT